MILNTTESPQELINNVTTPGGCTEIGNNILINSKVEDILFKTIKRTMDKAKKWAIRQLEVDN
jgi:pyrroline-5-carboxylate reductase